MEHISAEARELLRRLVARQILSPTVSIDLLDRDLLDVEKELEPQIEELCELGAISPLFRHATYRLTEAGILAVIDGASVLQAQGG